MLPVRRGQDYLPIAPLPRDANRAAACSSGASCRTALTTPTWRGALADKIVLPPGNVFSVSQTAMRFLRFNVAQSSDPRVFAVVERAMRG